MIDADESTRPPPGLSFKELKELLGKYDRGEVGEESIRDIPGWTRFEWPKDRARTEKIDNKEVSNEFNVSNE